MRELGMALATSEMLSTMARPTRPSHPRGEPRAEHRGFRDLVRSLGRMLSAATQRSPFERLPSTDHYPY